MRKIVEVRVMVRITSEKKERFSSKESMIESVNQSVLKCNQIEGMEEGEIE